jgi:hypothetical protein
VDEVIQLTGGDISIPKSFWTICPGWEERRGNVVPVQVETILPTDEANIHGLTAIPAERSKLLRALPRS